MTVLNHVQGAVEQTVNAASGLGRVATSPIASNRSTSGEAARFVKREVGTVLDFIPITFGTTVLYMLLAERNEESAALSLGKGVAYGVVAFTGSYVLRRVVM